jgi:hypothetical protein
VNNDENLQNYTAYLNLKQKENTKQERTPQFWFQDKTDNHCLEIQKWPFILLSAPK